MRAHHIVLIALAAPILGVAVVLWFLLPGSVAGLTYSPSQFSQDATLRPTYWTGHDVTLRGYIQPMACLKKPCPDYVILGDKPRGQSLRAGTADPAQNVILLAQGESGLHSFLRRLVPMLVKSPIGSADSSSSVTVTGRLVAGYAAGRVPVIRPNPL